MFTNTCRRNDCKHINILICEYCGSTKFKKHIDVIGSTILTCKNCKQVPKKPKCVECETKLDPANYEALGSKLTSIFTGFFVYFFAGGIACGITDQFIALYAPAWIKIVIVVFACVFVPSLITYLRLKHYRKHKKVVIEWKINSEAA